MLDFSPLALAAATIAGFLVSSVWYGILGARMAALQGARAATEATTASPPPWKIGVELLRSLTVATAMAALVSSVGVSAVPAGLGLGLAAWVAFPVTLLIGAAMWDDAPIQLCAIHAGDWLLKLLAVAAIVTVWQ